MTASLLNPEQRYALAAIATWLNGPFTPFFVLKGSAGTGKTFCVQELTSSVGGEFAFTAPTNKATKVIRETVTTRRYKPVCKTIYSLLGLRLTTDNEIKGIEKNADLDYLAQFTAVVVDEGSMVNQALFDIIQEVADNYSVRFLFMGDAAQLPPVNEKRSPIWDIANQAELTKVMRHDNAILELATRLRDQVDNPYPQIQLKTNVKDNEGVWRFDKAIFEQTILDHARLGLFSVPYKSKVIAWRNSRVDTFNDLVRNCIFDKPEEKYVVGDRVIFTSHAMDPRNPDRVIATTDDEGVITEVDVNDLDYLKSWMLNIQLDDDDRTIVAQPLHEDSRMEYDAKLEELASYARIDKYKWHDFWALKERFHQLRYAYAITAHRAQGSTYDTAFVCHQDILRNRNIPEAYRCLYVACTRPKRNLILS